MFISGHGQSPKVFSDFSSGLLPHTAHALCILARFQVLSGASYPLGAKCEADDKKPSNFFPANFFFPSLRLAWPAGCPGPAGHPMALHPMLPILPMSFDVVPACFPPQLVSVPCSVHCRPITATVELLLGRDQSFLSLQPNARIARWCM
jgi:hypothetical protein